MTRVRWSGLLVVATACGASEYRAKPLEAGIWRVECLDLVDRCLREAERVCGNEGYHVLAGTKDTKMFGAEQGYQTGADLHVVEFRCGIAQPEPPRLERNDELTDPPAPEAAPKGRSCTPGATQRCVGPGACEGGQSCNPEGTGFLPCDCGTSSAAPPAPAEPSPTPDTSPPAASATPGTEPARAPVPHTPKPVPPAPTPTSP